MPADADDALDELRALLALSRSINVPQSALKGRLDRRVIITMWKRADETVETFLRLYPNGVRVNVPRVITALVARWLLEGLATITWMSKKRDRVETYLSHGTAERVKFFRELFPELGAAATARAKKLKAMPNVQQRIAEMGVDGFYAIYRGHCDASHWNSVWLQESMRESQAPPEQHLWVRELALAAAHYRLLVGLSAEACGRKTIEALDTIPSTVSKMDQRLPP